MSRQSKELVSFAEVTTMIQQAHHRAVSLANSAMVDLYWRVGEYVSKKISSSEWGKSVVTQLASYIAGKHPGIKGFSDKNIWRMKQFYETYSLTDEKLSPLVREINWTNNLIIMSRAKSADERFFYLNICVHERLSKRELERQIDSCLFERSQTDSIKLSPVLREMVPEAEKVFRDKYVMEFIGIQESKPENSLRKALIGQMKNFVLELGKDYIFVDEEFRLQVGNSDFYVDLLFYHRELQCLVAFELKTEKFKPEHLGQLNFYLEALDRDVKKERKGKSKYRCTALQRLLSPTMVAEYKLNMPDKQLLQQKLREIEG